MPLSQKQLEYLALAWECFESQPKINYDKLAQLTKLSNGHCAREMFRSAKKKLTTEYAGAVGNGTETTPKTTKTTTSRGKISTPANTATTNRKKQIVGGNDGTPTKGKRGRPATNSATAATATFSPEDVKKKSLGKENLNSERVGDAVNSNKNDGTTSEARVNNLKRRRHENISDNENTELSDEDLPPEGAEKKMKTKKSKTTTPMEPQIKSEPNTTEDNRPRRTSVPFFKPSSSFSSTSTGMGMGLGMGMGMSMFGENDEGDHHPPPPGNNNVEIEDDDMFGTFTTFQ